MAAAALVGLVPETAGAHEANRGVRVELDAPTPALDGIDVSLVVSVTDQLILANTTSDVLEVLDDDGEPFLRIGPDGVEANVNAVGWYQTNNPFGLTEIPARARPGASPEWAKVSVEPSWGWFDHRLHPSQIVPPPEVVEAGRPAELAKWSVPVRWRGEELAVTGSIVYRPVRGSVTSALTRPPDVAGLTLTVLQGRVPGLFLENDTAETVVVLGSEGEPFLRFDKSGVQANLRSPAWLAAKRGAGEEPTGQLIDPSRRPAWQSVSKVPRFGWIEPRAGYPDEEPPEDVIAAQAPTTLTEWEIPLRVGDSDVTATGVTTWEPVAESADGAGQGRSWSGAARVVAVGAAVLGLGWLLLRRRRAHDTAGL